jgi:hypothetical protein
MSIAAFEDSFGLTTVLQRLVLLFSLFILFFLGGIIDTAGSHTNQ